MLLVEDASIDPRDEPAPFYETVALTALAAAAVMAIIAILGGSGEARYVKLMLLGPFGLVFCQRPRAGAPGLRLFVLSG
jgi:hypothetical protein